MKKCRVGVPRCPCVYLNLRGVRLGIEPSRGSTALGNHRVVGEATEKLGHPNNDKLFLGHLDEGLAVSC